jgi:uncharacterized SAM-binding protein YcdF (DUF218 family)
LERALTLNYLIWTFIKPSHIILFLAMLGIMLWKLRLGRLCRDAAVVLLVGLGLLPAASFAIRPLETRFPAPSNPGRVDGIIVLAGSEMVELSELYGQPLLNSHGDRLLAFLMLAEQHPDARLVHTGSREAAIARTLILGAGVDPGRLVVDDRSQNTCASGRNVRELVSPRPDETWLLVTSAFHMPRAMACFRAAGWDVTPYPTDYRRGSEPFSFGLLANLSDLDLAAHEWVGLLYYRLRGYTNELFPVPERKEPAGR